MGQSTLKTKKAAVDKENKGENTLKYMASKKKSSYELAAEKIKREPEPPRFASLKRPITGKQLDEQKSRNQMMPTKKPASSNFPIKKPAIKPDPKIEHEFKLAQHSKSVKTLYKE